MGQWDERYYGAAPREVNTDAIEAAYVEYMAMESREHGTPWYGMACHMLGLRHGEAGARVWRRAWSDHRRKNDPVMDVYRDATAARMDAVRHAQQRLGESSPEVGGQG